MSSVRKHFCTDVARGHGAVSSPRKYGLNGTIPAIVNRTVGSCGIRLADGTTSWPRLAKYPVKAARSWFASIRADYRRFRTLRSSDEPSGRRADHAVPAAPGAPPGPAA